MRGPRGRIAAIPASPPPVSPWRGLRAAGPSLSPLKGGEGFLNSWWSGAIASQSSSNDRCLSARPEAFSRAGADRRRAARRLRLRHPLHRARRSDAGRAGAGQRDCRCLHALADRGGAGGVVPRMLAGRQGARHRRQFRQFQYLYRPRRQGGRRGDGGGDGATVRLRPEGGVHLVDRRDRRAAGGTKRSSRPCRRLRHCSPPMAGSRRRARS